MLSQAERDNLATLGPDLATVWAAHRKELLRAVIEGSSQCPTCSPLDP